MSPSVRESARGESGADAGAVAPRVAGRPSRLSWFGRWWTAPTELRLRQLTTHDGRLLLQGWLASRGLIALVALLLAVFTHREVLAMVNNWDAVHFGEVARYGYGYDRTWRLTAFFPGLPLLLKAGLLIGLPTQVSGMIIAGIGSLVAAVALARMGGPWAAVVWLFLPTAVFTTVPYTESLCAFAFWAWERARSDKWLAAVLLTAAACTVRVSGLFLIGALFVMIITTVKIGWLTRLRRTAMLIIPIAVLGAYSAYLHALTGSWTAWYDAQVAGWYRGFTPPWQSLVNTWSAVQPGAYADRPYWVWIFRGEMLSMLVGVALTIWCVTRKMWAEASWVAVQVLAFSLSYWFMSVNRAVLLWFPLAIMISRFGALKPRRWVPATLHRAVLISGSILAPIAMLVWAWLFFCGYWAS